MASKEPVDKDEDEGAAVGAEGEKKGGNKLMLIIIAAAVLIIGGGAGLFFTGMLDGLLGKNAESVAEGAMDEHGNPVADGHDGGHAAPAKKDSHAKASKGGHGGGDGHGEGAVDMSGPQFMEIPDLIVNLSSTSNQPRFLKLKVSIEVENGADLAEVEAVAPRVIDHFQTYLRELRVDDLKGSAGIYRLRQELVRRVNAAAYPVKVRDVLFQEILIQ